MARRHDLYNHIRQGDEAYADVILFNVVPGSKMRPVGEIIALSYAGTKDGMSGISWSISSFASTERR
jgi:hypothetical protein